MSNSKAENHKAVTLAIASTGSAAVGRLVDAGFSSQKRRLQTRQKRAALLAKEQEKCDAKKTKD
ncbi:hypothetical protein N7475_008146 [Penicillium sp. IBT 31633x]|nr:hypothetical protein N7475_008146 [Penicillium sp. IBT 31633x]